ncbi:hypothetical protein [Pelosinus fermentans]|uniref:DUF91 domain-containing protein n=1 Tax=Pelosinus fermentans JBW45 TaxID=1192197 RepID=I8TQS6_9FIRM|nr:hypothetical protein [Pelosinus fermentans]AJQ27548.1 hypothetical protein JBW_02200 [Pelosinus fermentans JBW45]
MSSSVSSLQEKEVQQLICDFPWLLNLDYEIIPELANKGLEYVLPGGNRIDLLLKDRRTKRPVIVEFKKVPFYRENIGQILEYKTKVLCELQSESSLLSAVFEKKLCIPILILVVPSCSAESRLACNLAGIEIYEYESAMHELVIPEKRRTLEDFISTMAQDVIPFNDERNLRIKEIYNEIKAYLIAENLSYGWSDYKSPPGEYYDCTNQLFINKYLFRDNSISIGIYENIYQSSNSNDLVIEFYSNNLDSLKYFREEFIKCDMENMNTNEIFDYGYSHCWSLHLDKADFIRNIRKSINPYVKNYIRIMNTSSK